MSDHHDEDERADDQGDRNVAEKALDELLPEVDWRHLMRTYPWPCLLAAAGGGYLLGRNQGSLLLGALVSFASRRATSTLESLLDESAE